MFVRSTKMTDGEKAELKKEVLAVTQVVTLPKPAKANPLSPKAREVKKILDKMPSGWKADLKGKFLDELAEALTGEKLSVDLHVTGLPRLKDDSLKKYMIIVPEENTNSSEYVPGKPIMALKDGLDYCLMASGKTGNHVEEEDCRFPTVEEVDQFLDELQKKVDVTVLLSAFTGV